MPHGQCLQDQAKIFMGALRGLLNMLRRGNRVPDMLIGSQDMLIGPQGIFSMSLGNIDHVHEELTMTWEPINLSW
jgi:hypothetical protein